jgi:hypothetical protein
MRTLAATTLVSIGCLAPVGHRGPGESPDASIDAPADAAPLPRSCRDAQQRGVVDDGVVMVDPDGPGGAPPFDVYCEMTTAGGGWTLVWSYGFTSYDSFTSLRNAITPRPSWGYASAQGTPVSTTTPASPTARGAMEFARWQQFGSELLVTSTINHWIRCTPGSGSLVMQTDGSVACDVVKVVPNKCTTVAPTQLVADTEGPTLTIGSVQNKYYYFDGSQQNSWPTHDPCGTNSANQLTGVTDASGAVYVREP